MQNTLNLSRSIGRLECTWLVCTAMNSVFFYITSSAYTTWLRTSTVKCPCTSIGYAPSRSWNFGNFLKFLKSRYVARSKRMMQPDFETNFFIPYWWWNASLVPTNQSKTLSKMLCSNKCYSQNGVHKLWQAHWNVQHGVWKPELTDKSMDCEEGKKGNVFLWEHFAHTQQSNKKQRQTRNDVKSYRSQI